MQFTREEFDRMVQEVLYTVPSRFDALCDMATVTIGPLVKAWCHKEDVLQNRGLEGDLMNTILLRLMTTVVHGFLRNDRTEGDYNDNPEGFAHWMVKVAHNCKRDYVNKLRREEYRTDPDGLTENLAVRQESPEERQERMQLLRESFDVVLAADIAVYKVLTWLAQVIFIVDQDMAHHKANALIVAYFEKKTLSEMYNLILVASKRVEWMYISPQQHARITAALQKPTKDGATYGEMPYGEFFQKYRGERAGKKSVSDWIHRINDIIERELTAAEDDSAAQSAPTTPTGKKKEGRG